MTKLIAVWIMSVVLMHGMPATRWEVKDCSALRVWLHNAFIWAERSQVKGVNGPVGICYWQEKT